jgi:hypothetical protein
MNEQQSVSLFSCPAAAVLLLLAKFHVQEGYMHKVLLLLTLMLSLVSASPAWSKTPYMSTEELQGEVQRGFEEILDLWHAGRFEELYERTIAGGKGSKEQFSRKLAAAGRRPSCCWEKLQDVRISVRNDSSATVRAKLGFEGEVGTEFVTRSFRLQKEDGVWRISQSDIFSLAGTGTKKGHHKKKAKKNSP